MTRALRLVAALASAAACATAAAPLPPRRVVSWLVPYANVTTVEGYTSIWEQWGAAAARAPGLLVAGSAYALKHDGTLGYATTTAGEGLYGDLMEHYGFPALRAMNLSTLAMIYVTHEDGIAIMLKDPAPFIASVVNATLACHLQGVDIDYEPQSVTADLQASFMSFVAALADALAAHGLMLTIDVGPGCSSGTDCASLARIGNLTQVNTEDAFGVSGVSSFAQLVKTDQPALGPKWAPGFEPGNIGVPGYAAILQYAATGSTGVRSIATWAVHEANVGPQPQGLFDALVVFLLAE